MVTGAGVATVNRLPVLLLPSDYFANRVPDPVLQQIEHLSERDVSASDAFRPVSRFFDRISRPEQLLASLPEAFRILTDPAETGAATVSLPEDVQAEAFDWPAEFFEKRVWYVRRPLPEPELIKEVVSRLQKAKCPIVITGGGDDLFRSVARAEDVYRRVWDCGNRDSGWRRSALPSLPPRAGAKSDRSKSQRSPHEPRVPTLLDRKLFQSPT
jgi:TPP-dependent trihydroxycyclohexane-1,2-dione (THcHDO) dehydratase